MMSERTATDYKTALDQDDLALHVVEIETALAEQNYAHVLELIENDLAGTWFGLQPSRTAEIMRLLLHHGSSDSRLLQVARAFFSDNPADEIHSPKFLSTFNLDDPREIYILTMLRLGSARIQGCIHDALEQCDLLERHL